MPEKKLERLEHLQPQKKVAQMTVDEREQVKAVVEAKFVDFSKDVQMMINNFQLEMIRQFEIQRSSLESLVHDYLLDEEPSSSEKQETFEEADGYDVFFFEKYVEDKLQDEEDSKFAEEDAFDNGYYF